MREPNEFIYIGPLKPEYFTYIRPNPFGGKGF